MKTHLSNTIKILTTTALIGGTIAATTPAYAIPTIGETVTTTIDARDLKTERGVAKIYQALERRAENACSASGSRGLGARSLEKECAQNLLMEFVQDIGDNSLTNYYEKMQS